MRIEGANENNLQDVDVVIPDGLTVVTGLSGSGKSSLVFDTLYHESRRRFMEIYAPPSSAGRLAPADVREISGLRPSVAVGQDLLNRNPYSNVASASGLHPFLRLLYARFGTRHCSVCNVPLQRWSEDDAVGRLVAASRDGPIDVRAVLVSSVLGSHATLLQSLVGQHGRSAVFVDDTSVTGKLDPASPHDITVRVHQDKTPLNVRAARQLYARVRSLGADYLELAGNDRETLALSPVCIRCGTWFTALEPAHFHTACTQCQGAGCTVCRGTGLHAAAASVRWGDLTLPQLMECSVEAVARLFDSAPRAASSARLRWEIERRLATLNAVGLGYLQLERTAPTLSRGEGQRLRLATILTAEIEEMLHVLDEPTVGLHPMDVGRVMKALEKLRGPVVYVEHDRDAAALADHVIDIGPGAGRVGGRVTFEGTPAELWEADTPTGRAFSKPEALARKESGRRAPERYLEVKGASKHNLRGVDVRFGLGVLNVVTGVSGSGKSTLAEHVIGASFEQGKEVGCATIEGFDGKLLVVDQKPIGRNPRSNPATYTKLADTLRDAFARGSGLSASHFSFNRPEGACERCAGMGATEVKMRYLPSTWIGCSDCGGARFSERVRGQRVGFGGVQLSITDVLSRSVDEVRALLSQEDVPLPAAKRRTAMRILDALSETGLGYLSLGQASTSLSGGEAQRVKLARHLGTRRLDQRLVMLDEPTTGLHPVDVQSLLAVLQRLVERGATVIVVEHNVDVIGRADWLIELGPGAGPAGGQVLYQGPAAGIVSVKSSPTAAALRRARRLRPRAVPRKSGSVSDAIRVRGAHANNLQHVDVDFMHGMLTVVTGVSGSGKSSLVRDVLELEGRRRFLESLSMYERQSVSEVAHAQVGSLSGLGVSIPLEDQRRLHDPRTNVGAISEISLQLAILFAETGLRACPSCEQSLDRDQDLWRCANCSFTHTLPEPRHFIPTIYGSACVTCHGMGHLREPAPEKLIVNPDKPLCGGAMYSPGFYPQGFFGKPFNSGYDILQALAERFEFDPFETPWRDMSEEAQSAFLFGREEPFEVVFRSRKGRVRTQEVQFSGVYGVIGTWDVGGTYTSTRRCPACSGARLRPEYLAVQIAGYDIHRLSRLELDELLQFLDALQTPAADAPRRALEQARRQCRLLVELGLGYVRLDRLTATLSAGEAQRLQLARIIAARLGGLTLLLDEPTRGLHPREVQLLIDALQRVVALGNTAVVIEHDLQMIRAADRIVDIGPGPGALGGRVIAEGSPEALAEADTATGRWLRGEARLPARAPRDWDSAMTIRGARAHNLDAIDVRIPLGVLVGVCGVSGSGKSSLIMDTLARVVAPRKHTTSVAREAMEPGAHDKIEGAPTRAVLLDQRREGIVSPASYLGIKKALGRAYGSSAEVRSLGLSETDLMTRCETCAGQGSLRVDMGFLPSLHPVCEVCHGSGLASEAREISVRGYSLPDLLQRTIDEVHARWSDVADVARPLELARRVGLGYLSVQQPARALSGGEVQRLRVAHELSRKREPSLYLLDEPSIGLHMQDVDRLLDVLHQLVDGGASVVLVEHQVELLAACDWLVELGPGGGREGGRVVAEGTPQAVAAGQSPTARFLRKALA